MKRIIAISILVIMTFTLFTGCDRILGKTGNNTNNNKVASNSDPRFEKQPGQGMSDYDAYSYVKDMIYPACIAIDYYAGKGMEHSDVDIVEENGTTYAKVNSAFASTLDDLKQYVQNFFAGDFLNSLVEAANLDSDMPKYKDIDGKLYMDISQIGQDSMFNMDTDTFKIVENTEEEIRFTMEGTIYGEFKISKIILKKINNGWKITYWNPESPEDYSESN